jgi:peptide/nickel transport system permease protein
VITETQAAETSRIDTLAVAGGRPAQSYWNQSWERLRANRVGMAGGALIVLLVAVAIAAPLLSGLLTHHAYYEQDLDHSFAPPGAPGHLLGTDELGRDTLTRLIWGARASLGVGFLAVAVSIGLGSSVGLLAGYYGGILDDLLMRVVDVILSIPRLFLFILVGILFFRQMTLVTLALVIASVGWGGTARLVRGEVLSIRGRDFMLATKAVGAGDARLILRHLLPNALPVLIVAASLGVGVIILVEAALDFLGLGIHPPTPTWGNMLSNSQQYFVHSPWLVFLPGAAIFLTVLAANVFGNAVRDAFDPRLR